MMYHAQFRSNMIDTLMELVHMCECNFFCFSWEMTRTWLEPLHTWVCIIFCDIWRNHREFIMLFWNDMKCICSRSNLRCVWQTWKEYVSKLNKRDQYATNVSRGGYRDFHAFVHANMQALLNPRKQHAGS